MKGLRKAVLFFAFCSGTSSLIFEILWARVYALVFGSTVLAVSAVVSSFFAGLAIGSFAFGRAADRTSRLLRLYGLIELGIGIFSLLMAFSPSVFHPVFHLLQRSFVERFGLLTLSRFLVSFVLFLVPTALMGGTFPVLARFLVRSAFPGRDVGVLYAVNTAGGVLGAFLAGFVFIGHWGVAETAVLAAAVNTAVGVSSLVLSRRKYATVHGRPSRATKRLQSVPLEPEASRGLALLSTAMAVSGFCALGYEVLWTRSLTHLIGTTSYAFTIMLVTFLTGIVLGSLVIGKYLDVKKNVSTVFTFGALEVGIGICALFFLRAASSLDSFVQFYHAGSWLGWLYSRFALSFVLLIVPTALLGATFPLAAKLGAGVGAHFGRRLGLLYSVNTLGGVLGCAVTGLVLIQVLGTEVSFKILGAMSGLLGIAFLFRERGARRSAAGLALSSLLGFSLFFSVLVPSNFFARALATKDAGKLVCFKERSDAAVGVVEEEAKSLLPYERLYINGTSNTGTNFQSRRYMRLQALIPILIHRHPADVLVMCFGTGMTLGAAALSPEVKRADCVEISKAVLDAAYVFRHDNGDVLRNQKVRVFVEDGRNFVGLATRKYDIITLEPSPPTDAGSVNLYTKEFYRECLNSLKQDGTVAQWIPFHTQSLEQTKMLIRSFVSVFPNALLFMTEGFETLIVGSRGPFQIDLSLLRQRLETAPVENTLREIGVTGPYSLLGCLLMDGQSLENFSQGVKELSDNHPRIEYFIPLDPTEAIPVRGALAAVLENLMLSRTGVGPLLRLFAPGAGIDEDSLRAARLAMEYFVRSEACRIRGEAGAATASNLAALRLDPENEYFRFPLGISCEHVKSLLAALSRNATDTESRVRLGIVYLERGQSDIGVAELTRATRLDPANPELRFALATAYASLGDNGDALKELQASSSMCGGDPELMYRIRALRERLELPRGAPPPGEPPGPDGHPLARRTP